MSSPNDNYFEDDFTPDEADDADSSRLGPASILLLLLMIAAMLATLLWPVLWQALYQLNAPPTPTPIFLREV